MLYISILKFLEQQNLHFLNMQKKTNKGMICTNFLITKRKNYDHHMQYLEARILGNVEEI